MHVPDDDAALHEVKRVLRPSSMIASRETIAGSSFSEPAGATTPEAWAVFTRLLAATGGHPEMGKELKRRLLAAGFIDVRAAASFDYFSSAEDIAVLHAFIMDWFFMPQVVVAATHLGIATREQFERWPSEIGE